MRNSKDSCLYFFFTSLVLLLVTSCGNENTGPAGCCDNAAINSDVGNGHVYIPNIFTPDNDGVNDIFMVFGDHNIGQIQRLEVRTKLNQVVFLASNINPSDNSHGWDGTFEGDRVNKGVYNFIADVEAIDGTIQRFEGEICNFPCDQNQPPGNRLNISTCQFPTQGIDGHFDGTIPNFESEHCFEH